MFRVIWKIRPTDAWRYPSGKMFPIKDQKDPYTWDTRDVAQLYAIQAQFQHNQHPHKTQIIEDFEIIPE